MPNDPIDDFVGACPTIRNPYDRWFGQDAGNVDHGCKVHCRPCPFSVVDVGARNEGQRWLRPSEVRPSRNAYGRRVALKTNEPALYPHEAFFHVAPCWKNGGFECFGGGINACDCDPQLDLDWEAEYESEHGEPPEQCRDGSLHGQLRTGLLPELHFTTGPAFRRTGDWIDCRREVVNELGARPVTAAGGGNYLNQAVFIDLRNCTSNLLAPCYGEVHQSGDCTPTDLNDQYYNDPQHRIRWGRWYVENLGLSIGLPEKQRETREQEAVRAIENAALAYICQHASELHLDQVEKTGNQAVHPNSSLDQYSRGWMAPTGDPREGQVYKTLHHCRLKASGLPVKVELVLYHGSMEMSIVLHKIHGVFPTYTPQLFPSIRFRLQMELGVRAEFANEEGNHVINDWGTVEPLLIKNPVGHVFTAKRFPWVLPANYDKIEYVDDDGRVFTPPTRVVWHGTTQAIATGNSKWRDAWRDTGPPEQGATVGFCQLLADQFAASPITIGGRPDVYSGTGGMVQTYLGGLEIRMEASSG